MNEPSQAGPSCDLYPKTSAYEAPYLFFLATIPRVALVSIFILVFGFTFSQWNSLSDAPSYINVAKSYLEGVPVGTEWDHRVFGGWPLLFLATIPVLDSDIVTIAFSILLAGIVPILMYRLTGDMPTSTVVAYFPPAWFLQASYGMSEAMYLCSILAALLAWQRSRFVTSGILLGLAGITRPTALFVCVALALVELNRKRFNELAQLALASVAVALVYVLINVAIFGDPLRELREYATLPNVEPEIIAKLSSESSASHFGLPFVSVITTPLRLPTPTWKIIYVWGQLLVVLICCSIALRWLALPSRMADLDLVMGVWALLNTAFIVSTGPYWGFHSFDRYALWALPAYAYLLRPHMPRNQQLHIILMLVCLLLSVTSKLRHL